MDGKIKAPPPARRMWLVGLEIFGVSHCRTCWRFRQKNQDFQCAKRHPGDRRVHSRQ